MGSSASRRAGPFLVVKRETPVSHLYGPETPCQTRYLHGVGAPGTVYVFPGNKFFLVEEEEREVGVQKRKRKKRKNHLQPERSGSEVKALSPGQNGDSGPEAIPGGAQKLSVVVLGAAAAPNSQEPSGWEHPPSSSPTQSRKKRHRKRTPRVRGENTESAGSPLEDLSQGGPSSGRAWVPAPQASPADGAPALKRKRKLGAPLVNGSGPPTLAWPPPGQESPPVSPADRGDCPAAPPPGRRLKKRKGEPSSIDLHDLSTQKTAIFKKRKRMKDMLNLNLVEHNQVLESEVKLVQALVRRPGSGLEGGRSDLWPTEQSCFITVFTDKEISR